MIFQRKPHILFAAVLLLCQLGCGPKSDNNAFEIPSPTNGQQPAEEAFKPDLSGEPVIPTAEILAGMWQLKAAKINGTNFPATLINTTTLQLDGEAYEVMSGGNSDKGTCVLDTTSTPYKMTISGTEGANEGKTLLAIVEMPNESTLHICYDLAGEAFPENYDSTTDNAYFSAWYVRKPAVGP